MMIFARLGPCETGPVGVATPPPVGKLTVVAWHGQVSPYRAAGWLVPFRPGRPGF